VIAENPIVFQVTAHALQFGVFVLFAKLVPVAALVIDPRKEQLGAVCPKRKADCSITAISQEVSLFMPAIIAEVQRLN
jgi:hypothetical protein